MATFITVTKLIDSLTQHADMSIAKSDDHHVRGSLQTGIDREVRSWVGRELILKGDFKTYSDFAVNGAFGFGCKVKSSEPVTVSGKIERVENCAWTLKANRWTLHLDSGHELTIVWSGHKRNYEYFLSIDGREVTCLKVKML